MSFFQSPEGNQKRIFPKRGHTYWRDWRSLSSPFRFQVEPIQSSSSRSFLPVSFHLSAWNSGFYGSTINVLWGNWRLHSAHELFPQFVRRWAWMSRQSRVMYNISRIANLSERVSRCYIVKKIKCYSENTFASYLAFRFYALTCHMCILDISLNCSLTITDALKL